MTRSQKFYDWWQNIVKGDHINNDELEKIINKLDA